MIEAGTTAGVVGITVGAVIGLVRGFQHRRGFWTRRSWIHFGGACGAALIAMLIGFRMMLALDNEVFRSSPTARLLFIFATVAVTLTGTGSLGLLIGTFGTGEPDRQFRFMRALRSVLLFRTRARPGEEPDPMQEPIFRLFRKTPSEKELPR